MLYYQNILMFISFFTKTGIIFYLRGMDRKVDTKKVILVYSIYYSLVPAYLLIAFNLIS